MSDLYDALDRLVRWQRVAWSEAASRGYATPDSDYQPRCMWEARELLDAAASALAIIRVDRPHDSDLADAEQFRVSSHHIVYRVECARHRELGLVAPGERGTRSPRTVVAAARTSQPATRVAPAPPARGQTGRR
jgi:hypothetical protein